MKFIHCADLHLDSKIDTIPTQKSKIRREEIVNSFERLCDYATENAVTAVIIAGDMFDTERVTSKTKARVLKAFEKNSSVDFLYLSGNHDDNVFLSEVENLPKNVKVFGESWTSFNYGNVVISGIDFAGANVLSAHDSLFLEQDKINVVVMHGQVAGYKSNEKAEVISIPKFKNKNVDYLALGHIHSYSEGVIDERGKYVYCGCLDGRGFDETGKKGFVLLETDDCKIKHQFLPFSSRCLYEVEFDVSGKTDWLSAKEQLLLQLEKEYDANSLLKIVLKGEHDTEFDVDKETLTLRLNERYFFAKVYDKTVLSVKLEDFDADKSVRGEFVRSVLQSELDEEMKRKVIMLGLNALKGEEI